MDLNISRYQDGAESVVVFTFFKVSILEMIRDVFAKVKLYSNDLKR